MTEKIKELERQRKKNLREAKRASQRRRKALRERRWEDARSALEVARRNRREAQDCRKRMRVLRRARSKANRLARIARHRRKVLGSSGVSWYQGKQVRSVLIPHLNWARAHGWRGYVTSGYRSPAYSEQLCRSMCGAPRCPGRCAGTSSNHVRTAIDVSDYYTFGRLMKSCPHQPKIFNGLGSRDPVHFSPNGV